MWAGADDGPGLGVVMGSGADDGCEQVPSWEAPLTSGGTMLLSLPPGNPMSQLTEPLAS